MRALQFITGHVIFKLRYNQIYQLKTTCVNELGQAIQFFFVQEIFQLGSVPIHIILVPSNCIKNTVFGIFWQFLSRSRVNIG